MSGWTMCRMMVLCTVSFVGLGLWTGCSKEYIACYGPFHVTSDTTVWFEGVTRGRVDHQFNRLMERHPDIRTVVFSDHCPGSNDDVSLYAAARVLRENGIRTVLLENSVVESGAVDLFIYGAAGLVTLQAAATLRDPSRLIPALPPQPTPAGGPTGSKEETLDAAKPPDEVMAIVRETLRAMELPESKVSTVLIGGTGFKSAGSLGTASGARLGIPVASLVRPLLPPHRPEWTLAP